jgi:hypothetical protein
MALVCYGFSASLVGIDLFSGALTASGFFSSGAFAGGASTLVSFLISYLAGAYSGFST